MQQLILEQILKQLKNQQPGEVDKSVMIKLTPHEIFNLVKMGATYWGNASKANTNKSIEEVCEFHTQVALSILHSTDSDRFEMNN